MRTTCLSAEPAEALARLRAIEDKQALSELLAAYARGIDTQDRGLLTDMVTEDMTAEHGDCGTAEDAVTAISVGSNLESYRPSYAAPAKRDQRVGMPAHPEARAAVADLRARMRQRSRCEGCAHIGLGKVYAYRDGLSDTTAWQLLEQLKDLMDPAGMLNPGALGLGR